MTKSLTTSCFFLLLYPALVLPQDPQRREESFPHFIRRFERPPLAHHYKSARFEWRDYLLRKLYPPPAFNQFAAPERLAPDFGQNQPNQTRSISSLYSLRASNSLSEVREAWINHFSTESAPGSEYMSGIVLDRFGNVYVTGSSANSPFGYDFLTAKYDASGKPLWAARYNGEGNGDDYATAISVDAAGNVYVIGSSAPPQGSGNAITIKYDSGGVKQWAKFLNEPNSSGHLHALAVDLAGNVYVTGSKYSLVQEYVTVKYNSHGEEQWRANYPVGSGGGFEIALVVDREGNVFVAGASEAQQDYRRDFLTIKYNASGIEQWSAHYDGPTHENDFVTDMGIDALGNVYVMGWSWSDPDHFALVKYNDAGVQQWVAHFGAVNSISPSAAIAVDSAGNAYVATAREQGRDYTTIKYNASGVVQWRAQYDNPNADQATVAGLALDHAGNVLVTGYTEGIGTEQDYTTVKYNANGVQQWAARYNGPKNDYDYAVALGIDNANHIYVAGTSYGADTGSDYATVKYNPAGQEQWVARYNKEGNSNDSPVATAMDAAGNIYVTGSTEVANTYFDYVTIKYNREGSREWVARYDGPDHGYDAAAAIAVDNASNVYVTGSSERAGAEFNERDYATIKYNAAGQEQWVSRYTGPGKTSASARSLAVDHAGNVYVTGSTSGLHPGEGEEHFEAYATVKYNADGVEQWVADYKGPDSQSSYATVVAVDGAGNVYVSGGVYPYIFATLKYNAKGVLQWSSLHESCCGGVAPEGLAIDGKNNIYLTGYGVTPEGGEGFMVAKYHPNGQKEWTAYYDGLSNGYEVPAALALDVSGNVYVTGTGRRLASGPSVDYVTVKFDTWGRQQWVANYNSPSNGHDHPSALAVDGLGNVYVTGGSFNVGASDDFATVKYNIDGLEDWVVRYNSSDNISDWATDIIVDNLGDVYVTGKIGGYNSGYMTTIKYTQQENANAPAAYNLSQSFPNPFADLANIRFRLPGSGVVTLKIYDVLGQEVETLLNGDQSAGEYRLQWNPINLPNGVYFYRLQAGDFVETKKLVLLR